MGHVDDRWTRPGPTGRRVRTDRWGSGKRWLARWNDPNGRERSKACRTRDEAEAVVQTMEMAVRRGDYVDPAASRGTTVGDVAARWLAGKAARKLKTRVGYESIWRSRLAPQWERVPLSRVTHGDIAAWVASLIAEGLSPSRVRQCHGALYGILQLAIRDRLLAVNPAVGVELPRVPKGGKRYLTHGQVLELIDAAQKIGGEVGGLLVAVAAYTGLRLGELLGLRVIDLDVDRRRLYVRREIVEVDGIQHVDTPKSHLAREVGLPPELAEQLGRFVKGRDELAPLLPAPEGGVWWQRNLRARMWTPATIAAGLAGLTPHELRHTAASLAVAAGSDVLVVQRMLGHASAAMTLDVYSDLFESRLDVVAEAMAAGAEQARRDRSAKAETDQGRTEAGAQVVDLAARRRRKAL